MKGENTSDKCMSLKRWQSKEPGHIFYTIDEDNVSIVKNTIDEVRNTLDNLEIISTSGDKIIIDKKTLKIYKGLKYTVSVKDIVASNEKEAERKLDLIIDRKIKDKSNEIQRLSKQIKELRAKKL